MRKRPADQLDCRAISRIGPLRTLIYTPLPHRSSHPLHRIRILSFDVNTQSQTGQKRYWSFGPCGPAALLTPISIFLEKQLETGAARLPNHVSLYGRLFASFPQSLTHATRQKPLVLGRCSSSSGVVRHCTDTNLGFL